jgi:hypothetical protein
MSRQTEPASTTYIRNASIGTERVEDHLFLIDPARNRIHALNGTAADIWEIMQDATTLNELVQLYVEAYPAQPPKRLKQDLLLVIDKLTSFGIIGHPG